jgi:hypothetical protein
MPPRRLFRVPAVIRTSPDGSPDVGDLGFQLRVGENLKVSAFHGFTPYRFQASATMTWLVPSRCAAAVTTNA